MEQGFADAATLFIRAAKQMDSGFNQPRCFAFIPHIATNHNLPQMKRSPHSNLEHGKEGVVHFVAGYSVNANFRNS